MSRARLFAIGAALVAAACQAVVGIDGGRSAVVLDAGTDATVVEGSDAGPPADAAGGDAPPPCRVGEDRCGGTCTDTRKDERNCGECGHSCLGAACANAQCEPELWVAGVETGSAWVAGDELLYRALPDGRGNDGGAEVAPLLAKNRTTGAVRTVVDVGQFLGMVPLGGSTWLVLEHVPQARLRKLDVVTRDWTVLHEQPTAEPAFFAAAADGADVFLLTRTDLRRVALDGSGSETVFRVLGNTGLAHGLAITSDRLYFGIQNQHDLWSLGRAPGSAAHRVDLGSGNASFVDVDQGRLLWASGTAIRELPLPAEAPATQHALGTLAAGAGVKRDGKLWIADPDFDNPGNSRVVRYDLTTRAALLLASSQPATSVIAVDDRYVYLPMYDRGIYRVAR